MDDKTPQPQQNNIPPANNQVPVSQPSLSGSGGGMKVIQPLDPNLQVESKPTRVASSPTLAQSAYYPEPAGVNGNAGMQPIEQFHSNSNSTSVYPGATQGVGGYQIPNSADNMSNANSEKSTFSEGYSLGSAIFVYQLIVGVVVGLIFYIFSLSVLRATNTSFLGIVDSLRYVVGSLVLIYASYKVLVSNSVKESLSTALFGVVLQSVIVATALESMSIIMRVIFQHGVTLSLAYVGNLFGVIMSVGFLIGSYFLTKLAWGIAFLLLGKISNKILIKAVSISVIAITIAGVSYHYLTSPSSVTGSGQSTSKISKQEINTSYYYNPGFGYQIRLPKGWVSPSRSGPNSDKDQPLNIWISPEYSAQLSVMVTTAGNSSLQSQVQSWLSGEPEVDPDFKVTSQTQISINGVVATYITYTWENKELTSPTVISDQIIFENSKGYNYTVDGNSYSQYSSSFSSVLKQSLFSFKP